MSMAYAICVIFIVIYLYHFQNLQLNLEYKKANIDGMLTNICGIRRILWH